MAKSKVETLFANRIRLYNFQGIEQFNIPTPFSPQLFLNSLDFKPDPSDFFVESFPKCGTTWTRMIMLLIFNNGRKPEGESLRHQNFLEFMTGKDKLDEQPPPRLIKSHLPFDLVPYNKETKYVYVTRNPFDCCVSFYKHTTGFPMFKYNGTFDEYFELFMKGQIQNGDYFRHVSSWYEHKDDSNILFILYEDMKDNPVKLIKEIGEFMGGVYAERVKDDEFVQTVLKYSDFKYMQEEALKEDQQRGGPGGPEGKFNFFRKGIVGDHKNVFSEDQKKRMAAKCEERLKGTTLLDSWRQYGLL